MAYEFNLYVECIKDHSEYERMIKHFLDLAHELISSKKICWKVRHERFPAKLLGVARRDERGRSRIRQAEGVVALGVKRVPEAATDEQPLVRPRRIR